MKTYENKRKCPKCNVCFTVWNTEKQETKEQDCFECLNNVPKSKEKTYNYISVKKLERK